MTWKSGDSLPARSMINELNIIHLPNNPEYPHREIREKNFLREIEEQGIENYRVWDGIFYKDDPIKAISQSHKQIVQWAKDNNLPSVIVAEDDFSFTNKGAWQYFLKSIPAEYDMFLSHIYWGNYDDTGKVKGTFCALTLYSVHAKFYDKFLAKSEKEHLDLVMNKAWRHDIRVCLPMVCLQMNGWSDNDKSFKTWDSRNEVMPKF